MSKERTNINILIEECQRGNQMAEDRIFKMYYPFVGGICRRYSRNKEESEEMLNDCFFRLFQQLDKYDPAYDFNPWLRKLTVNCCLRYLQKHKKRLHFSEWNDETMESFHSDHSLPEASDLNYLNLLHGLPEASKTIINLYVIEGYKHHEIAQLLNISVGTSKSNLHRAKKLLYEMLERAGRGKLKLKSNHGR